MEKLRGKVFWIKDKLSGGEIRSAYEEMSLAEAKGYAEKDVDHKIQKLLNHASDTTVYYKDKKNSQVLSDFPVVNKNIYKQNYEQFRSSIFVNKKIRKMSTSGSTGTPFTMIHNVSKIKRCNAAVVFFGELSGYHIGEKMTELRVWSRGAKKNRLAAWMMNMSMIDISKMSDEQLEEVCEQIRKEKIKSLVGYSSTYTALVGALDRGEGNRNDYRVHSIIAASEMLPESTERKLTAYFGIPVSMRYSNMENGIIAERIGIDNKYYIDATSYYIEILKMEEDKPAEEGEVGRIVVTDLYNYAFPVIRYDTGDTGAIQKVECEKGKYRWYFTEVYGRRTDIIYDTNGRMLSPHTITNHMWDVPGITQFKFIQQSADIYELILNVNDEFEKEKQETDIVKIMQDILGTNANIEIIYVDEIPVLASGKRKYIENRWKQ